MGYLKERIKHAVRFRHKRGYGVHSPFMFNLILNVIRDREKQFQYPERLERENCLNHRERKIFPLIIPFGTFASGTSDDLPGKKCRYPLSVFAGSL